MNLSFLTFSDGAKYALIAKSIFLGQGFTTTFSFWGQSFFATHGIPYLVPYIISLFFRVFGVTDFAVISFSFTFYLLLIISSYLLAKKLTNNLVAIMTSLAIAANHDFIIYSRSGATEPLFAFEIIAATYLLTFRKIKTDIFAAVVIGAMYFTRPQAAIFIAGLIFYWLILRTGIKKGMLIFFGVAIFGLLFDRFVIYPLSFKYPIISIYGRGMESVLTYSSNSAVSDALRGGAVSSLGISEVIKKTFYNLYNFYKSIPDILNPYLFILFVIGLFLKGYRELKIYVLFVTTLTLIVTALSIPFYRYIHPIIPLLYLVGSVTLYEFVNNKKAFVLIIILFTVGQTVGNVLLDSRFENKMHNLNKPPVYVLLSQKLKQDTKENDLILTNLDTWGSWYGERKTVWFPLEPKMIEGRNFDAIYLTSYKIDDANYFMGDNWRKIFNDPANQKLLPEYKFVKEYKINAFEDYEKEDARAILLIRK